MAELSGHKKIVSFTGLRFIMMMTIVLSHFSFLEDLGKIGAFYSSHLQNGTLGVVFFFVLSGFGMMLGKMARLKNPHPPHTHHNSFFLKEGIIYGIRHVRQIYPVYMATIVIGFLVNLADGICQSESILNFLKRELVRFLVHIPLLQSATGMKYFAHAYNGVSWFLSTLFCIYLFSPLFMFCLCKFSKSYFSDMAFLLIEVLFIMGATYLLARLEKISLHFEGIPTVDYLVYASPYSRVFYVLSGMSLAKIFERLRCEGNLPSFHFASFLEITVSFIFFVYFFVRNTLPLGRTYRHAIDILVILCFTIVFAFDRGCISHILGKATLQWLGKISMYIFLIHYPVTNYFGRIVDTFWKQTVFSAIVQIIIIISFTFGLAAFCFHCISCEKHV